MVSIIQSELQHGAQETRATSALVDFCRLDREDVPALLALEKFCFATPWSERQFNLAFEMNLFYVFGLKSAGCLLGYISFYVSADEMEILNLAIAPEYRRRGLGARLLGLTLKIVQKMGAGRVLLEVRDSNTPARNLYDRCGFKQVGRRKAYYPDNQEDALLLRLDF